MARLVWSVVLVAATVSALDQETAAQQARAAGVSLPNWIWCRDTCGDVELKSGELRECSLARRFALKRPVQSATLQVAADFYTLRVQINGQTVLTLEPYSSTTEVDVTAALKAGENKIALSATPCGGPAAVALSLSLVDAEGKQTTARTRDCCE